MNTQAIYGKPRDKSLSSAKFFKSQQRATVEHYEDFFGKPAPQWMYATVEDIARHIDMVYDAAMDHGVQLKWEQIEYGKTWEEICEIAKAKQSYQYTIGDYLPREAKHIVARWLDGDKYEVRDYFGIYYITRNGCVCGLYKESSGVKATTNNLTSRCIFALRFESADAAIIAIDSIKSYQF